MPAVDEAIEAWFAGAGAREADLRRVDAIVRAAAPDLPRELVPAGAGTMLGYGLLPYRTRSSAATARWPLVALAAQKRHLSLYVCAVVDGQYLPEARAERLGKVSCGRSCVRFTSADRVDADALSELVRDAAASTAQGRNEFFES
ncbi:DUF1801 domain-containing protein [Blastococcus sp. TF02A-35]|uniref:DUF1801 domain-containing protein n=1 Tax=Blastococcus sp. TF02A-35 TaxID=2559612 RepID=UPI001073A496|nr:DUF1801 domain-containing protein [Blastococcus sp. TF02A_35]TFV52723.1 DUF1801 domain-containing protein [Blastococcus sp. TF02A_35]